MATLATALCFPILLGLFGTPKKSPTEVLYRSIYRRDLAAATAALDSGADVNGGQPDRLADNGYKENTPLSIASMIKDIEIMKLLIKRGADVNARNGKLSGVTTLEMAIALTPEEKNQVVKPDAATPDADRRLEAVQLLLKSGADPKRTSRLGSSPLAAAAGNGSLEIAALLVGKGAPVNGEGALDQPMIEVARYKKPVAAKIAELLISHGAKVDVVYAPNGDSALHVAAGNGNIEVAQVLVSHGAKLDTADRFGSTPLHRAAAGNHLAMVKFLLEHGAKPRLEDMEGRTPLMRAKSDEMKALLK